MKTKQQYIAPTMKCVEFKVERGYAMSQGVGSTLGNNTDLQMYIEDPNEFPGNRFGGYFSGNNDDWD